MTAKTDFTTEEWTILRDTPHIVSVAMATAGGSGLFGSLKEAIAPVGTMIEALKGDNQLLRAVCDREEAKAAFDSIKSMVKSGADFEAIKTSLRQAANDKAKAALDLLKRKNAPEDVKAYQDFLLTLANKVANAAKEGAFLGFGGERVSEPERTLLAELAQSLGVQQV